MLVVKVYDSLGIYSSPRAWWLFQIMGHENVWVLDGGLPAWAKAIFL
jgi:thiosulfate/3-mercaptopyruvate sulfurtransferase